MIAAAEEEELQLNKASAQIGCTTTGIIIGSVMTAAVILGTVNVSITATVEVTPGAGDLRAGTTATRDVGVHDAFLV
ncbi:hypothetical protein E2562_026499 [Oryza meyeriana var. granulata]|uniref:Uncharacterized protein n=1 Tax=Oryza meyeriana var. granulata TaxID=110450 RepID=A0A6G1DNX8_9ORYZ|nr:hypothetical protein E2562_026499 [Oryza meyeriana var. granulata]